MTDKPEAETKHANPYTLSPSEVGERLGAKHVALQEAMGRQTVSPLLTCSECGWGAMTDGAMDGHMRVQHPQRYGIATFNTQRRESMRDAQQQAALGGMSIMRDLEPVATPVTQRLTFRGLHTTPSRVFTREEVLTVLTTLATQEHSPDPDAIFARIISTFERME